MNELKTGSEIIFGNHQHLWCLFSVRHTMTWLVTTHPPLMRSNWREYYKNGSLLQYKQKKKQPWEWSFAICHLAQIFACCCKGNAMKIPQARQRWQRGSKSCDAQPFSSCSGSSRSCLNRPEFAQVPGDGQNAACCIHCLASLERF